MARMLPAAVHADTTSPAERAMFTHIRDELSNDWIALHSLGLTIHDAKPWAEVDFVLIGPPGVFCLEVKGGHISRKDGIWYTTPQHGPNAGRARELRQSPFEQVGSAAAALFRFIERTNPKAVNAITGYAIAAPDVDWTVGGPDIDLALVYDQRDTMSPFSDFMDRVTRRWSQRIGSRRGHELQTLGRPDKQALLESVRGDFQLIPSLRAVADSADRELVRLTDEQCALFARLASNPRVIARGGAGTGKTVIAAEEARRLARQGNTVLYLCFNRNLARHVADVLAEDPGITVRTLHSLMSKIVEEAGRAGELPDVDESDLFALFLPELALEVILESPGMRFDVVLIDEAQDLLREPYLDVIEALSGGDLTNGTWRCFLDPNQNLFRSISPGGLDRLRRAAPVDWPLTISCRNTRPIAIQVALLSSTPLPEVLVAEGPDVQIEWYASPEAQRDAVSARLRNLKREGFTPERIAVLSRYRLERSVAREGLGMPLRDVSRGFIDTPKQEVTFSTISSFKGLEADVILLTDVDDLTSADGLASVYVGASRARVALYVFLSDQLRHRFSELSLAFGRAAAALKVI